MMPMGMIRHASVTCADAELPIFVVISSIVRGADTKEELIFGVTLDKGADLEETILSMTPCNGTGANGACIRVTPFGVISHNVLDASGTADGVAPGLATGVEAG